MLYSLAKRHTNTEEQFLRDVAQFSACTMDEIGLNRNITQIDVRAEEQILFGNGSER